MVTSVNGQGRPVNHSAKRELPRIIELVGPAGSGKTTLSRALCQQTERRTLLGLDIEMRRPQDLPVFLRTLPTLLPLLTQHKHGGKYRFFSWDEIKALAYVSGWHQVFKRQAADGSLVLLDHGPIFRMAKLSTYGPAQLHEESMQEWWAQRYQQWGTTLDLVVWLDAPNPILEQRIKNRNQRHVLKDKSGVAIDEFLDNYRRSYRTILDHLSSEFGLRVLHFDTSQMSIEQVIAEVQRLCTKPATV